MVAEISDNQIWAVNALLEHEQINKNDCEMLHKNINFQSVNISIFKTLRQPWVMFDLEGESKKSTQHFCITFQKVSLLVLSYTSIGQNEMFQGLKWGIVRLCTSKILGDIGKNRIYQFFVFHTFT